MIYEDLKSVNETLATVNIKRPFEVQGKDYVTVNERIRGFRMLYPEGTISTEIISLEDGVVTMKTSIYYGDILLATGFAQEKENASFINKTSFIENCVPLDAQILTPDGWKFYYQLKEGEKVWGLNLESGAYELCELVRVNLYESRPLVEMSTSRFKMKCTAQHKWITAQQYKPEPVKKATEELKNTDYIICAIPQPCTPSEIGKKLGWLMCDCEVAYTTNGLPSTAYIRQAKYVDEVSSLFGEGKLCKKYNDKWMDSYEWRIPAETVREIFGKFGIASYRDLAHAMASADINDVRGCYESMMMADGISDRGFASTYPELVDAMQIMCARLGIATTFITESMKKNSTRPINTLGIRKGEHSYFSEMTVKKIPPKNVWCPTTSLGTWIMKQGSFVSLTSNCETSSVGRALGMLGIGNDSGVASAEEMINALANQGQAPRRNGPTPQQIAAAVESKLALELKRKAASKGVELEKIAASYGRASVDEMNADMLRDAISKLDKYPDKEEA